MFSAIKLIIILAAFLRLYKLGEYPVSIYWDEAAIGYNAYSIAKTGADEYGKKWPIAFESFNDYKLPGYIYLDSIFVKFLGLSEFSVRLPSAIAGILAVLLFYLTTKKLHYEVGPRSEHIALVSALLLAISPWHIQLSRAAFETNIALSLTLAGVYFLFLGINKKIFALFAIPTLALSFYFYYSPHILVPLVLIAFFAIFKNMTAINIKFYFLGLAIGAAIIIPAFLQLTTAEGSKRVREVSVFTGQSLAEPYIQVAKSDNTISKLFLNRRIPLVTESLENYSSHFSPGFLFFGTEENPRHHPLYQGNFYIWQIPFLVSGLWFLIKLKDLKVKYFLIAFLFISPIPAAFAIDAPHSLRSFNLIIPLTIIIALGIIELLKNNLARITTVIVALLFFTSYLYNYYVVYPISSSDAWAYGYKPMFEKVRQVEGEYDRIIITGHYWKPYIYYLFYNKIDPRIYQSNPNQLEIGKYRFSIAGWDTDGQDLNEGLIDSLKGNVTLLVISPEEFDALEDKNQFSQLSQVRYLYKEKTVFLIGRWQ